MPVISMLRLCNAFQIPLSAFFRDVDAGADGAVVPGMPTPNDILEPAQGYASSTEERQHGERSMLNPLDVRVVQSVVPGVVARPREADDRQEPATPAYNAAVGLKDTDQPVSDNISNTNLAAILDLEHRHMEQQHRLLDIIAEQQKQIANLTRLLNEAKLYDNMGGDHSCMVADRPTRE